MKSRRSKMRRLYTKRSFRLMKIVRMVVIVLLSPIWVPFWLITWMGYYAEDVLQIGDSILDWILDRTIPQLKEKGR